MKHYDIETFNGAEDENFILVAEQHINKMIQRGWRLHTFSTVERGSGYLMFVVLMECDVVA